MASTGNIDKRAYAAGHFEFAIDGAPTTAYVKSIDGGYMKASLVDEPIGPENLRVKHASVAEIDPFSIEFGLSGANSVLKWIQSSWNKDFQRRHGQITHADFKFHKQVEHEFWGALITETTFPTLDGASKEDAYIKIKMQPEKVITTLKPTQQKLGQTDAGGKHKMWQCSGFRLSIDGIDEMDFVNKIDSFTIKQGVKKMYTGAERLPEIEPTKIEFPSINGTIATAYAGKLFDWYDKAVRLGQSDTEAQKHGSIDFLSTDRKKTLFSIELKQVGIQHLQIMASSANADQIKRAKFELFVGEMKLDLGGLGFD